MARPSGLAAWFLLAANLVLLSVMWIVSINADGRLPQDMASWSSVWTGHQDKVVRSFGFFVYPLAQVVFFGLALGLAEILFLRAPRNNQEGSPPDLAMLLRLLALKREVAYLALIFVNLLFIHLQTTRILLSHDVGGGINKAYFSALILMIVFILGPYLRIRRKLLRTGDPTPSQPR